MSKQLLTTKQFMKLSRANRAIIIAKDVIKQIKLKLYKSNHSYSTALGRMIHDPKDDAAELLRTQNIVCQGCARASLFISAVKYKNKINIGDVEDGGFEYQTYSDFSTVATDYLSGEFTPEQQALIENAYEDGRKYGDGLFTDIRLDKRQTNRKYKAFNANIKLAKAFKIKTVSKWRTLDRKTRGKKDDYVLTQICKNIVKNSGIFKP